MNVLRREGGGTADHDLVALVVPLEDGPGSYTQTTPNFRGNGNLPLCGYFRVGDGHTQILPR